GLLSVKLDLTPQQDAKNALSLSVYPGDKGDIASEFASVSISEFVSIFPSRRRGKPISSAIGPSKHNQIAAPRPKCSAASPIPSGMSFPNSPTTLPTARTVPLCPGIAEYNCPARMEYQ